LTPETQPDHYPEKPETGLPVLYWPRGKVDKNATPLVGFVHKGWDLGMADINVLPEGDGVVQMFDGVFHIGDRRVLDAYGKVSSAADRKGVWEPTPWSRKYIQDRIKALGVASTKSQRPE
jgi:hypothetical protein